MKFPLSKFTVFGDSMLPELKPGQLVITFNWFKKLEVGDVVVVNIGSRDIIKRLKGIKAKSVFVIGDNEVYSTDSRTLGWIDKEKVIGKVATTI